MTGESREVRGAWNIPTAGILCAVAGLATLLSIRDLPDLSALPWILLTIVFVFGAGRAWDLGVEETDTHLVSRELLRTVRVPWQSIVGAELPGEWPPGHRGGFITPSLRYRDLAGRERVITLHSLGDRRSYAVTSHIKRLNDMISHHRRG